MDNLEFLDGPTPEPEAVPEVQPEAQAEPEGQPRGPDGKFLPKEAEPAPEAAPEPVQAQQPEPAPEPREPAHVPVSALQEERQKRQALEQRLAALEQQRQQAPPPEPPDRYQDPEAWEAWRDEQIETRLFNERLNTSERFARKEYGSETVEKVQQWAVERGQQDPLFGMKLRQHPDPYEFAVQEWKRDQVFAALKDPSELDQFLAWKAQQANPQPPPAEAPAPATPAPSPPPRSLASAPSAGTAKPGEQPVGPGVAFDAVFTR
jgi:hypothetical protein